MISPIVICSKCMNKKYPIGFIKPNGDFIHVSWGNHEQYAGEYILSNDLMDEEESWQKENKCFSAYSKDFLILSKGWVLLDSPGKNDDLYITFNYNKITKKQIDFLIDYFIIINDQQALLQLPRL